MLYAMHWYDSKPLKSIDATRECEIISRSPRFANDSHSSSNVNAEMSCSDR